MMSLAYAAELSGARHVGADAALRGVSTDTRSIGEGTLFIALRGERFDGHDFVLAARDKGAAAAMVDERAAPGLGDAGLPLAVVGDTRVEHRAVGRGQGLGEQALQVGLDGDDVELANRTVDLLDDRRGQADADAAGQLGGVVDQVGGDGAVLGHGFDDRAHVADVHALFEEQLEHFLQGCDADHLGNHVFDQFGSQFRHVLDELLCLDAAQKLGGVELHQV